MHTVAQTNLQLFDQLECSGYTAAEMAQLRDAYALAVHLFLGWYAPCGKPFLDHLVGVASILGQLGRPSAAVSAALLHAAHSYGDFGFTGVLTSVRRAAIRRTVGEAAEATVWAYRNLRWAPAARPALYDRIETLTPLEREALVMRLANTLELHLDLAALYQPNADRRRRAIERDGPLITRIAERLGLPALAAALTRTFQETLAEEVPEALRNRGGRERAYFQAPWSYRRRLPTAIAFRLARIARRGGA